MSRACVLAERSIDALARCEPRVIAGHAPEDLRLQQHGAERGAKLVRERRKEEILGAIGPLGLEPRLLLRLEELRALVLERAEGRDVVDGD